MRRKRRYGNAIVIYAIATHFLYESLSYVSRLTFYVLWIGFRPSGFWVKSARKLPPDSIFSGHINRGLPRLLGLSGYLGYWVIEPNKHKQLNEPKQHITEPTKSTNYANRTKLP